MKLHGDREQGRATPFGRDAFTILEIILVLALIGLIGAVVGAGVVNVFSKDHLPPEEVFWQACRSAQKMAALSERETSLTFDEQKKQLVWTNGKDTEEAVFDPKDNDVRVQFLEAQNGGSRILIAGRVVETQEVPRVMFYPDGTCTAFHVQFREGKRVWQVAIDPWTCAPMLEKTGESS